MNKDKLDNMKRYAARLVDKEIWKQARISALNQGISLAEWINRAFKSQLESEKFTAGFSEEMIEEFKSGRFDKKMNKPILTNYKVGESKND